VTEEKLNGEYESSICFFIQQHLEPSHIHPLNVKCCEYLNIQSFSLC